MIEHKYNAVQVHRVRALSLLGQFLDMGAWCVELALSVGIFPYVLKLLQTTLPGLRASLVFIWCKILATDKHCQTVRFLGAATWHMAAVLPIRATTAVYTKGHINIPLLKRRTLSKATSDHSAM